jgi:hypothetical protein
MASCAAQEPLTVPVKRVKGLLYIPCSIADSGPLSCLLDSGSSMTGLSRDVAARLNLKVHTDDSIARIDIASQALDNLIIHVGTASWMAERLSIAPADLSLLDRESGENFHTDVVLGTSFFEHFQITVDPDENQIHLGASGSPLPRGAEKIFTIVQGIAFTVLQIKAKEGRDIIAPFSIDTGSRPSILLGRNFWATRPPLAISNLHGAENELMVLDGVRFGSQTLNNVPAGKPLYENGLVAAKSVGGVLGAPVLNRFMVVYDYSRNGVWIKPTTHLHDPF